MTPFKQTLHRGMLVAVAAVGMTFLAAVTAEAAKPALKNHAAVQHHQSHVPIGYYDVWGNYAYYGYPNAWAYYYSSGGFPYSGGPYYYENPTFGLYGNPGYVSPGWGMDVVY